MSKTPAQKKIINILFIAAIVFLSINLVLDKFFVEEPGLINSELTPAQIDSTFRTALLNLGIRDTWIKEQKGSDFPISLSIRIPQDLPIVLILQEMNNVFDTNEVKVKSIEKKIGGSTSVKLLSGGDEKLSAQLIYSNKVKRKSVRVGFIIKNAGNDKESDSILAEYPENLAFLIIPSSNSAEFIKRILRNDKEYIVYLNDAIDELKFKLSENYSTVRLKNSIREIVGTFPGAVFFMIDDKSSLYNSDVYPLLKDELGKRRINFFEESSFKSITISEDENLYGLFENVLNKLEGGEDEIFILSAENFLKLKHHITRYRKLGYRFTNPSALLSKTEFLNKESFNKQQ